MTKKSTPTAEQAAAATEWAVVVDGKVHAAIWKPDGGGFLTVYTTVERHKETVTTCMYQRWCSIGDLGFTWDERHILAKQYKAKVCKHCEEE